MAPGSQKSVLPGIVYLASSRNSTHTSSVFYSRNFLLVFSTFLLVFLCVITDIGLYGAAESL